MIAGDHRICLGGRLCAKRTSHREAESNEGSASGDVPHGANLPQSGKISGERSFDELVATVQVRWADISPLPLRRRADSIRLDNHMFTLVCADRELHGFVLPQLIVGRPEVKMTTTWFSPSRSGRRLRAR